MTGRAKAIAGFGALLLLTGCASQKAVNGPPVDRVALWYENPQYSTGNPSLLKNWIDNPAPTVTVYNPADPKIFI